MAWLALRQRLASGEKPLILGVVGLVCTVLAAGHLVYEAVVGRELPPERRATRGQYAWDLGIILLGLALVGLYI